MRHIILTRGLSAIVDAGDYDFLDQWSWYAHHSGYALRNQRVSPTQRRQIYMHRAIMGDAPDGLFWDHINRNKLDNRRQNFRLATKRQNCANGNHVRPLLSGLRGVHFNPKRVKGFPWVATLMPLRKSFKDPIEAARQRDIWAREKYGEFADLNFPDD